MSHNVWLYIKSMKAWWRTIGNIVPPSGKIFDYRTPFCHRCKCECSKAIDYNNKFYCFECHSILNKLKYNVFKFMLKRETYI